MSTASPIMGAGSLLDDDEELKKRLGKFARGWGKIEEAEESNSELFARRVIPPSAPNKVKWDLWLAFLILYSVMTVPYRLGFNDPAPEMSFFWWFDWVVDVFFVLDMCAAFRTAYVWGDEEITVTMPKAIAVN